MIKDYSRISLKTRKDKIGISYSLFPIKIYLQNYQVVVKYDQCLEDDLRDELHRVVKASFH